MSYTYFDISRPKFVCDNYCHIQMIDEKDQFFVEDNIYIYSNNPSTHHIEY